MACICTYTVGPVGIELIKKFEGLSLVAYKDHVGIWTIGYGTTNAVLPPELKIVPGQTISKETAEKYLCAAINNRFSPAINRLVKAPITQNQFDALVTFTYNCGEGALGSSTLLRKLNAGDYVGAQREFLRWNKAGGKVARGLTRRRLDEAVVFGPITRSKLIETCLNGVDPDIKPK